MRIPQMADISIAVKTNTKVLSLTEFKKIFNKSLITYMEQHYQGELKQPITNLIEAGGKRIRPYIIYLFSFNSYQKIEDTIMAGILPELIHTASLVHDDIIDNAEIRRGIPTIHAKWNTKIAVLTGDLIFAMILKIVSEITFTIPSLVKEIVTAIEEMIEGQALEEKIIDSKHFKELSQLKKINQLKTASLFSLSFYIGMALRDDDPIKLEKAKTAGKLFGNIFQIYDDLIDIFGDRNVMGKNHLNDIKEGIITIPVAITCNKNKNFIKKINMFKESNSSYLIEEIKKDILYFSAETILSETSTSVSNFRIIVEELDIYPNNELISIINNLHRKIKTMLTNKPLQD